MFKHDFGVKIHIDEMIIKECNKVNFSYRKIAIFNSMRKRFNFFYKKKLNFNNENK